MIRASGELIVSWYFHQPNDVHAGFVFASDPSHIDTMSEVVNDAASFETALAEQWQRQYGGRTNLSNTEAGTQAIHFASRNERV